MSADANRSEVSHPRLALLWQRLKDHRVAQWTVGYVAVAYGIQHAVILTSESYEWPNIVARATMTLLVLGLPLMMTLAWYHGNRANRHTTGGEMAIVSVMLVGLSLAFYLFFRPASVVVPTQPASFTAAQTQNGISIAVLPFLNLAGDPREEFFSDGMTEEITSALAKIPSLRVVGRTSAFQFKGKAQDLRGIGQTLSATHLIEGSVRKDGNELRITAQLIRVQDGTHLWTESYDRELKGVFAVQEEIAQAIAGALRVPLGLKQGETLVTNRNIDPDSYQEFLRARQLLLSIRTHETVSEAVSSLQRVIARNPDYAPAWSWLFVAYDYTNLTNPYVLTGAPDESRRAAEQTFAIEEAAAQRAFQLEPTLPTNLVNLATLQVRRGNFVAADQLYVKALAAGPNDPQVLQYYSNILAGAGYLKEAIAMKRKAQEIDPLAPVYNRFTSQTLWVVGDTDHALQMAKNLPPDFDARPELLGRIYASMRRYSDAADALSAIIPGAYLPGTVENAVRLLRQAPSAELSAETLPRLGLLGFIYLYTGAPERALEIFETAAQAGLLIPFNYSVIWHPSYAVVRKTDRFKIFARKAGLVEYWRAKGWPPQCHPTTGDDFECS